MSEPYPYLILDAHYEREREGGVITSDVVLIAVAADGEGPRQLLAGDLVNRESRSRWRDFLLARKQRGLHGVEFVASDDHPGLKAAIRAVPSESVWQRCYVHYLGNALIFVRRKDNDCPMELRGFYDRRDVAEVRRDRAAWLAKWQEKYPQLSGVETHENVPGAIRYPNMDHLKEHKKQMIRRGCGVDDRKVLARVEPWR